MKGGTASFLLVVVPLLVCACGEERQRNNTEVLLEWFFANGGTCGTNHVDEILVRGHTAGADEIQQRESCDEGSDTFPPEEKRLPAGNWQIQATALDANGQSCFDDVVEQRAVAEDEQPTVHLIFHKSEPPRSASCGDVDPDVDGGVVFPPDAGDGG